MLKRLISVLAGVLTLAASPVLADNYPIIDGSGATHTIRSILLGGIDFPLHDVQGCTALGASPTCNPEYLGITNPSGALVALAGDAAGRLFLGNGGQVIGGVTQSGSWSFSLTGSVPLAPNAAQETGGNLAAIAANTASNATSANQSTANGYLSTLAAAPPLTSTQFSTYAPATAAKQPALNGDGGALTHVTNFPSQGIMPAASGTLTAEPATGYTTTSASSTFAVFDVRGFPGFAAQAISLGVGSTAIVELSLDPGCLTGTASAPWIADYGNYSAPNGIGTVAASQTGPTSTAYIFNFPTSSATCARIRLSALTSGTYTALVTLGGFLVQNQYVAGTVTATAEVLIPESSAALTASGVYTGSARGAASYPWGSYFTCDAYGDQAHRLTVQAAAADLTWFTVGDFGASAAGDQLVSRRIAFPNYRCIDTQGSTGAGTTRISSSFTAN